MQSFPEQSTYACNGERFAQRFDTMTGRSDQCQSTFTLKHDELNIFAIVEL